MIMISQKFPFDLIFFFFFAGILAINSNKCVVFLYRNSDIFILKSVVFIPNAAFAEIVDVDQTVTL